MNCNLYRLFDK